MRTVFQGIQVTLPMYVRYVTLVLSLNYLISDIAIDLLYLRIIINPRGLHTLH